MHRICTIIIAIIAVFEASAMMHPADSTQTATRQDSVFRQMELKGVTIAGRTAIQKDNHTNYIPTQLQVERTKLEVEKGSSGIMKL